jgi:hypothetical protein
VHAEDGFWNVNWQMQKCLKRNLLAEVGSNYIVKLYCSFQADEHPTGRVNIGGGRSRANRRRIPKEVRKLLQNEEDACSKICMNKMNR